MRTLNIDNKQVQLPTRWNELTAQQILHIATIYNTGSDVSTIKVLLFLHLAGIKVTGKDHATRPQVYQVELKGDTFLIKVEDIAYVSDECTKFILTKHEASGNKPAYYSFNSTLTNNPIPTCHGMVGPDAALGNITWAEFCAAQTAYANFCHTKYKQHLHRLIAILWRYPMVGLTVDSAAYKGDLRQPFNDFQVDNNAKHIEKEWKANHITAALFYYEGCINYMVKRYADLFAAKKGTAKSNGSVFDNMLKLTLAAADNQETKMKEVFDDPAHQVLFSINEAIKANNKMEQALNSKSKMHAV
jgi:hypothetical protein